MAITAVGSAAETTYEYAYDASGQQIGSRDPLDTVTRTFYDGHGRVDKTVLNCTDDASSPAPPSSSWWTCAGTGLANGTWNLTTERTYDSHGNVATETQPNGRVISYVYDVADRQTQKTDGGLSTYYAYDDAGRQVAVRAPTANSSTFAVTAYKYNDNGQLEEQIVNCTDSGTTPPGDPAWKTCAGAGTHNSVTNIVTSYEYDDRGNRVAVTEPDPADSGATATVTTRYAFDGQNRLCGVLEIATEGLASPDPCATPVSTGVSENVWTAYGYDGLGNMTSMSDGNGHTTTYDFDASGRMTSVTDADGGKTTYGYDDLGRRTSQSERGSGSMPTLISWTYDAAGRIATRETSDGKTTYQFDTMGNLKSALLDTGKDSVTDSLVTATYDRLNRPITIEVVGDSAATTTYSYDLFSPSWTDPSGSYSASLDNFGRETSLTDPVHGTNWSFDYRADGQLAVEGQPNGTTLTMNHDGVGRLTGMTASRDTLGGTRPASAATYSWTYNAAGKIMSENSTIDGDAANGSTSYSFDHIGHLVSYTRGGSTTTYGWSGVPNRTSVQVGSSTPVTYSFDGANRLASDSASNVYQFDDEGRLIDRPGQHFIWNDLGQLTAVRDASNTTTIASYTYDALDRLLTVDHPGSNSEHLRYVGLTAHIAYVDGTATYAIGNDWSGDPLFTFDNSGDSTVLGFDAHHDVAWTADDSGGVTATAHYDPWGNLTASAGTLPDLRFQSSWYEGAADLSWIVTRWYAPSLAQFISEDTQPGLPNQPESRHLYAYGGGDPISRRDPTGQFWYEWHANDTLQSVAALFYGTSLAAADIYQANVGRPYTPVNLATVRPPSGSCLWVPFLARPNNCSHWTRPDSTRTGTSLYAWFDVSLLYTLTEMRQNAQIGAGGVGYWQWWNPAYNSGLLFNFGILECPGCPWDQKPWLSNNVGSGHTYWTAVRGDWVPETLFYDVWANIHYGYVGRAHGIPPDILIAAQAPIGDFSRADLISIHIGMSLWNVYGYAMNDSRLRSAILDALPDYRRSEESSGTYPMRAGLEGVHHGR